MIEKLVVAAIVAVAALWLLRRWMPAALRTRLGLGAARGCAGGKPSACGKGDCGGCH